jgi:hypothetical protein
MTVTVTKPQATLRELLAALKKKTGLFGEQVMRAETASDFYSVIGDNRNVLINGSMDIWQRATSWGADQNDVYTADRWHFQRYAANGVNISRQSATDIGFNYCLRIGRASGNTDTTSYFLNQPVEGLNSARCLGKYVTFSYWIRTGSAHQPGTNFSSAICWHTNASYPNDGMYYTNFRQAAGSSGSVELNLVNKVGTVWKRFEQTAFIPANAIQVGVAFGSGGNGTATSNDYFEVTGLQLEIGTAATPFEYRQFGQELALCQRYYYADAVYLQAYQISGQDYSILVKHPTTMRTSPTLTFATAAISVNVSAFNASNLPATSDTVKGFRPYIRASSSGLVEYNATYTANAEL